MRKLILQLHNYVGLVNFVFLMVLGIVGVYITLKPDPRTAAERTPAATKEVPFSPAADLSDPDVALLAYEQVGDPTASPDWNPRRNEDNDLTFMWWGPNGRHEVTYLEAAEKLRIVTYTVDDGEYINRMHTIGLAMTMKGLPMKLWRLYVEVGMVSLLFMAVTGLYLWLAARWHVRWAQLVFLFSLVLTGLLYLGVR